MKTIKEYIAVDIYKSGVHLMVGDDIVEMRNSIIKDYPLFSETKLDNLAGLCTYKDEYCGNMWIFLTPDSTVPAISHECNHAAMHILRQHGVEIDVYNQEPLTYLQEYILSKILEFTESKKVEFLMYNKY